MFAPVLAFWLGFGILPKLVVVALVSFFSIVVATTAGLAAVDPDLIKLMRTFDASRLRTFWHVELPSALPSVFTGAKIAVAVSVIGAVFAEYTGSNSGLGYVILISTPQLLAARGVAATVILSLFAIALFGLLALAERLVLPWAYRPERRYRHMKRLIPIIAVLALVLAGCGEKTEAVTGAAGSTQQFTLMLDWIPERRPRRHIPGAGRGRLHPGQTRRARSGPR